MSEAANMLPDETPERPRISRAMMILGTLLGAGLVIWLLSGFYQVQTGQVAIVERLGQYVSTSEGKIIEVEHGLHYHLPWPIDRVSIVSYQQNFTLQINAFNTSPTEYADFKLDMARQGWPPELLNALFDPYVVTADKSVVHVELNVLFRINDPAAWATSVSHEFLQNYDPNNTQDMRNQLFQQIAQRTIVAQVASMTLDRVLREGRTDLERGIQNAFQEGLQIPDPSDATGKKTINFGVGIQSVTLSVAQVPDRVKPAYDNLVTQLARSLTVQKNAEADANAMTTRAEGEKGTLISVAKSYKDNTIQAANGEADRFSKILEQYNNAPETTRVTLWIDAARTVYSNAKRIFFVQPGQHTTIIVDPPQYDAAQTRPG